ncbi:MAG TPA: hypothetical protein VJ840_03390 [Gemmatimonadaceae bacterium]|nr:hypothetical protein [Gemmatimonadaceae bacterium]
MTATPVTTSALPRTGFQNLTAGSATVLAIAILSALSLPNLGANPSANGSPWFNNLWILAPHLLIIASISTGFRILGDVVAFPVGFVYGGFAALFGVLSGLGGTGTQGADGGALGFAVLQLVMSFAAGSDLVRNRKRPHQPVKGINRLLGLSVPLVVILIAASMVSATEHRQVEKVRSLAVDREIQARNEEQRLVDDSQLDDLINVARCIERTRGDTMAGPAPASLLFLYGHSPYCGEEFFQRRTYEQTHNASDTLDTIPHPHAQDKHHVLYYAPPKNNRVDPFHSARFTLGVEAVWNSTEWPNVAGHRGTRNFLIDPDGKIHVTGEHRRATIADSLVPVCDAAKHERPEDTECAPSLLPRQRWGVVDRLPWVRINHVVNTDVAYPATAAIDFIQVNALDSVRSVTADWGDGQRPTVVNVRPAGSMIWIERAPDGSIVRVHDPEIPQLQHQYRRTGPATFRATVLTRSGAEYSAEWKVDVTNVRNIK